MERQLGYLRKGSVAQDWTGWEYYVLCIAWVPLLRLITTPNWIDTRKWFFLVSAETRTGSLFFMLGIERIFDF